MGDLILNVIPYALAAAAAAPVVAVVTAVILAESRRPLLSAWTFTAGAAALAVVFSVVLLAVAAGSGAFDDGNSEAGAIVDLTLGAVFLVLGVMAIFSKESPEKEASRRERVERVATAGLGGMLVAGVVVQVVNIDALAVFTGALKEVAEADVSIADGAVAVLVGLAVMLLPYYGPAVVYALSPERSSKPLRRMSEWLLGHSRGLEIVVGLGFGLVFAIKGISTL